MLGENIYNLRKNRKISQEEFAEALNTTRQAVSKWERNEAKPDIDKLILIAKLFNVSIDYLLDHEITNSDVDDFIAELKDSILNNKFILNIEDIKLWCSKYPNNFKLHIHSSDYLYIAFMDNKNYEYLDLALKCMRKAIILFNPEYNDIISLNDLHYGVSEIYLTQKKFELCKEYIMKNNIHGCDIQLAKCELALNNYDKALETASDIYIKSISNIGNSSYIQIISLLENDKIEAAYDLVNWAIEFINSIKNNDQFFTSIIGPFLYIKAITQDLLNIDNQNTIRILKDINVNLNNFKYTSEYNSIKHYYGKSESLLFCDANIKNSCKEILNQVSKHDLYYSSAVDIYNKIFGGDINE